MTITIPLDWTESLTTAQWILVAVGLTYVPGLIIARLAARDHGGDRIDRSLVTVAAWLFSPLTTVVLSVAFVFVGVGYVLSIGTEKGK